MCEKLTESVSSNLMGVCSLNFPFSSVKVLAFNFFMLMFTPSICKLFCGFITNPFKFCAKINNGKRSKKKSIFFQKGFI
mgnify:CR=1 FL=1